MVRGWIAKGCKTFLLCTARIWTGRRGERDAARPSLEAAFREGPGDIFGRLAQALTQILAGHNDIAVQIVDGIVRQRETLRATDGEITYKEAQIYALAGANELAVDRLATAVEEGFFCAQCLELDPSFADLRESSALADVLARARDRQQALSRPDGNGA